MVLPSESSFLMNKAMAYGQAGLLDGGARSSINTFLSATTILLLKIIFFYNLCKLS
jgi:hypothetical protein